MEKMGKIEKEHREEGVLCSSGAERMQCRVEKFFNQNLSAELLVSCLKPQQDSATRSETSFILSFQMCPFLFKFS